MPGVLRRRVAVVVGTLLFVCAVGPEARAQSVDQIKAAFLFNFARYVEWPGEAFASPEAAVKICLAGSAEFAAVVTQTVSGKRVEDRPVQVDTLADLGGSSHCHILYVGEGLDADAGAVASRVAGANVFTVADRDGFARAGGIANFIRMDNKVRFEINPGAAREAGLKVSSRLLRLAKVVE